MAELQIEGHRVLLDDADLEKVAGYSWHVNKHGVAYSRDYRRGIRTVWMKWLISGILLNRSNTLVKHANGDSYDMRRENLVVQPRKWQSNAPKILCACGCGAEIPAFRSCGLPKKFAQGHYLKWKTEAEHLAAERKWGQTKRKKSRDRFHEFKRLCMEFFGNVCCQCGLAYNGKNAASFEFDHVDPASKEVIISKLLHKSSLEAIATELVKCRMLCANCHNYRHTGDY